MEFSFQNLQIALLQNTDISKKNLYQEFCDNIQFQLDSLNLDSVRNF